MDLSVYISELLNENGTVSIPQIGVFRQVRMRGYYNADEGKLYPPYYQTEFEHKPVDDDSLLQYIINKSNISATSAKYFMDKYLHNILQQAEIGEVIIGKIGWISKDEHTIHFRPAPAVTSSPAVFGFAPVSLTAEPVTHETEPEVVSNNSEIPQQPTIAAPIYSVEKTETIIPAAEAQKTATSPLLRQPVKVEKKIEEPVTVQSLPVTETQVQPHAADIVEKPHPFYIKPWFFALIAAAIVAVIIFILYPRPEGKSTATPASSPTPSMDSIMPKPSAPVVQDTTAKQIKPVQTTDTAAKKPLPASTEFAPEVETPAAAVAPTLVNTKNYKFVLMSGAFGNAVEANKVVSRYKAIGVDAAILKNISPSKYVKVTLGFFKTYAEGQAAKVRLVKLKHLRSSDLYVETLRTKRK